MDPDTLNALRDGLLLYLVLVISIALHEWGHAISADKVGDPTPRAQGRVTLNPLAHLDPIGTGLIPGIMIFWPILSGNDMAFFLIGWGKPVMVNPMYFRNKVRDDLIVTACGPLMNVIIALAASTFGALLIAVNMETLPLVLNFIFLNCALVVFNMIPVPPLDGSHFLRQAIGMSDEAYLKLSQWGFLIMIVLINIRAFRELMGAAIFIFAQPFLWLLRTVAGFVA